MKTKQEKTKKKIEVKIDLFEQEKESISKNKMNHIFGGGDVCDKCHEPNGQSLIPSSAGTDL